MPFSALIVIKDRLTAASALAATMSAWLTEHGARAVCLGHGETLGADAARDLSVEADVVIVLGGDGTFLSTARYFLGTEGRLNVPLMGVNFGRVGFLTEFAANDWERTLEAVLNASLPCVPRMILAWELERQGERIFSGYAVNDVVVGRGALARVATLHVEVAEHASDGSPISSSELGWVRADGLIVSSPLGSSAYSLSAGGPLVHPAMPSLTLTAIAPFMNCMPPMVLPESTVLRLTCGEDIGEGDLSLTVDGQEGYALMPGDSVRVACVSGALYLLTARTGLFMNNLRERGFIRNASSLQHGGSTS